MAKVLLSPDLEAQIRLAAKRIIQAVENKHNICAEAVVSLSESVADEAQRLKELLILNQPSTYQEDNYILVGIKQLARRLGWNEANPVENFFGSRIGRLEDCVSEYQAEMARLGERPNPFLIESMPHWVPPGSPVADAYCAGFNTAKAAFAHWVKESVRRVEKLFGKETGSKSPLPAGDELQLDLDKINPATAVALLRKSLTEMGQNSVPGEADISPNPAEAYWNGFGEARDTALKLLDKFLPVKGKSEEVADGRT